MDCLGDVNAHRFAYGKNLRILVRRNSSIFTIKDITSYVEKYLHKMTNAVIVLIQVWSPLEA